MKIGRRLLAVLVGLVVAPLCAYSQIRMGWDFYDQLGSGLRITGITAVDGRVADTVTVKNVSTKVVVGFELAITVGSDERLDPNISVEPVEFKRFPLVSAVIQPGQKYALKGMGVPYSEVWAQLVAKGIRTGVTRIGVRRVIYADGQEQNFRLLNDEQSRRSLPPPDTGNKPATGCDVKLYA